MRPQVGLQLRNADPGLMKEFVLGVHERAAQLGKDGERRGTKRRGSGDASRAALPCYRSEGNAKKGHRLGGRAKYGTSSSLHTFIALSPARAGQLSKRAQLMLDLIIDIKNNKASAAGGAAAAATVSLGGIAAKGSKSAAASAAGGGRRGGALAVLQPGVAKWLAGLGVDEVCLRGLTWPKLLAPNKKGKERVWR